MTAERPFEIGLFTFGEITADPVAGRPIDPAVRVREFIALATLADQAGLDVFGVGEHHRRDFAIASPPVVLAAIAQATERIRLTSAVTVSRRSSTCSCASTVVIGSRGRASTGRRSSRPVSIRVPCRISSRCGSPSAAPLPAS